MKFSNEKGDNMSNAVKLGNSVVEALIKDRAFANKFESKGYHINEDYVDSSGDYLFTSAWVVYDNELVFEDFSNDPDWFGVDYAFKNYCSIDISKAFMFDVSVIEPFTHIEDECIRRGEAHYSAYSDFDSCIDLLEEFCPRKYKGKYKWSNPQKISNLSSKISFLFDAFSSCIRMVHIKDCEGNIFLSMYSDFDDVQGSSRVTNVMYGENIEFDKVIVSIVTTIEKLSQPVKEVYFVVSENPRGCVIARKNPDGELTLTVY